MAFCDEVQEGERKRLDLSILHVKDLDVPKNVLRFSVVKAPHHGGIIGHGSDGLVSKKQEAGSQSAVFDFTLEDLKNGTIRMSVQKPNFIIVFH